MVHILALSRVCLGLHHEGEGHYTHYPHGQNGITFLGFPIGCSGGVYMPFYSQPFLEPCSTVQSFMLAFQSKSESIKFKVVCG